ncbi:MAG: tRNA glutamyl-Q(34) synthetase GluQRS [Planctomycetota bacterium]
MSDSLKNAPPRGRLAPSPTGALHLGNARTFLLAWLSIRARGGTVILRIEDLDGPRTKAGAEAGAIDDLHWLGLDWDEGPDRGGAHAPYRQTERANLYQKAIDHLLQIGAAYPCVCTRSEIETAASAPNAGDHETRYPGTCRGRFINITEAERAAGRPASIRFVVPDEKVIFTDLFCGDSNFSPFDECGDFVIEKAERSGPKAGQLTAAYQLACVIDDFKMGITEVLRGGDLLSSTARQILLQKTLGFMQPDYIHTPILVGGDGRRLAKRHGDTTIRRFREAGVAPEQVVGWLASVSGLADRGAHAHARELLQKYQLQRIPSERVVVTNADIEHLLHS